MTYYASLKQDEWPPETLYTSFPRWLWRIDNLLCQLLSLNCAKVCVPFLAIWRDDPCAVDGILCCIPGTWPFLTAVTYHRYPLSCLSEAAGKQEVYKKILVTHSPQSNLIEICSFIRWKGSGGRGLWSSLNFCQWAGNLMLKNYWNWPEWKSLSFSELHGRDSSRYSEGVHFGKLPCLGLVAILLRKIYQNQQLVLYSNGALGIKMCQKHCNVILTFVPKCLLVGPLCSVSCADHHLLAYEWSFSSFGKM